jgi:RNA polymerase-interacting CarD/CdnL/TRCF family regulator
MSVSDYEAHTNTVSDSEIAFLAEIFTELIRKEEQHERSNDETL